MSLMLLADEQSATGRFYSLANAIICNAQRSVAEEPIQAARLPGNYVTFGPFKILPSPQSEIPIGRAHQPIPYESVSRLHGYVGLDEYGFYVREVPHIPERGMRPSTNGIWVRQPDEEYWRRLAAGQAERISPDSDVRIGGNGMDPQTGLPLIVRS